MNDPTKKISRTFDKIMRDATDSTLDVLVVYSLPDQSVKPQGAGVLATFHAQQSGSRTAHVRNLALGAGGQNRRATWRPIAGALNVASVTISSSALEDLAKGPDVVAVMPNQAVGPIRPAKATEADIEALKKEKFTWGLKELHVPSFWSKAGTKGRGVKVAVLDSGVYADHPALDGRVSDFVLFDPLGRQVLAVPAFDSDSHGTHVCGTIAGDSADGCSAIGVAPEAKLAVGVVLLGERGTLAGVIGGLNWAIATGASVINMSLGFSYYEPMFEHILLTRVVGLDIVPVAAVGNDGQRKSSCPGNCQSTLSVGAIDNSRKVAEFSGGETLDSPPPPFVKPDVVAPGVDILSCVPPQLRGGPHDWALISGTSMAAPHVAGIAAILKAAVSDSKASEIMEAIRSSAEHPNGSSQADDRFGRGVVSPTAALEALRSARG